jgi:hypothetical protein
MVSVGEREVGVVRFGEVDPALAEVQGLQGLNFRVVEKPISNHNVEIPMLTVTERQTE